MSTSFDLSRPGRVTVGAIGPPGKRVFYFQARQEAELVSLKLEKEQVLFLAGGLSEVLADLASPTAVPGEAELALEEPVTPAWSVGSMQLAYDPDADRVVLVAREVGSLEEDDEDGDDDADDEDGEEEAEGEQGADGDAAGEDADEDADEGSGADGRADGEEATGRDGPGEGARTGGDRPGGERPGGGAAGPPPLLGLEEDDVGLELPPGLGEGHEGAGDRPGVARVLLTREQAAGVIEHGKRLLRGGRPPCPYCGFPLGQDHSCPKMNGHHAPSL
ncbi:MAG TPA: DUF3090 family protein [Acidimicrobiales bacterium]|nr:DUF3090 family protein [Acidimicrobiales bacterium]